MSRKSRMPVAFALIVIVSCTVGERGKLTAQATEERSIVIPCVHRWPSILDCPDVPGLERNHVPIEDVDSVRFGFFVDEQFFSLTFAMDTANPDANIDAIFITRDAVNKFLIPWYVKNDYSLDSLTAILSRVPKPPVEPQGNAGAMREGVQ